MTLAEQTPRGRQHKTEASGKSGGGVQSLTRALSILDALAESEEGLTLTLLARRVDLPPSTAHRLLTTLQRQRFVRFEPTSMAWQVGVQAFVVGNAFVRSRDLVAVARPYMHRLMEESGETANLYVLSGGEAICMAQVQCRQMIQAISRPGGRVGLHFSAAGKAILSQASGQDLLNLATKHGLPRVTPNTIVSLRKLQAELSKTRSRGFAIDDEECALGLRCVASPIHDERGFAYAALSLAVPLARMPKERLAALGEDVRAAARSVTIELGGIIRKAS